VPETISAVLALDFIETLALDRRTGICAHCQRPLLLEPVQAARVRDGKPVYHADCHEEHRRRYIRAWQQANSRQSSTES
jgi:RNase P subunit RPR2